jgi:hypothetical protein
MAYWYVGSDKYNSITAWPTSGSISAGTLTRQNATPTVGNERVFAAVVGGTTGGSEPSWTVTKGAKTTDNTVTWQEVTGQPGVNGDLTNCPNWTAVKNTAVALGTVIQRNNGVSLQVCTTAGTAGNGSEPSFSDTAGTTTTDNTVTWTSLGVVGNFAAFAAPHARLANAFASTWGAAGDTFYVSSSHAETQASQITLAAPGTTSSPNNVLSVPNSAAPPTTVSAGASISSTGANNILPEGFAYVYGLTLNAGTGSTGGSIVPTGTSAWFMENCTLTLANNTGASQFIYLSATSTTSSYFKYVNCVFNFGASTQGLRTNVGRADIVNGSFATAGVVPTTLLNVNSGLNSGLTHIRDSDLSNITGSLVIASTDSCDFLIERCKLASGVAVISGGAEASFSGTTVRMHSCDDGTNNRVYRFYEGTYAGTVQQETTNVRTGGASDGTTSLSFNMTTSANSKFGMPLESPEIVEWNSLTGSSHTATIQIISDYTLTNGDIWLELEYLGDSGDPKGTLVTSRKASILASSSNVATSSATWGGSQTTPQQLQVTFTPQQAGPVKARIYLAKPSATVYVDPLITIT